MEVFKGQPTPEGGEKTPYAIFLEAQPDTIVYRDGHDEPTYYTKQQIRDACKGIELVIEEVYNLLDWQAPDTLVSECTVEYELYKVTDRFTVMQDVHTGTHFINLDTHSLSGKVIYAGEAYQYSELYLYVNELHPIGN